MLLRFITLTITTLGLTSCIGLNPSPDNTKMVALGLSDLAQTRSTAPVAKGYIARPDFPVYMEGNRLKVLSKNGELLNLPDVRWAEPIDTGVARALSSYIGISSDGLESDFYPWVRTNDVKFVLKVRFHHLIATDNGHILASASWEYDRGTDKTQTGFFVNNTVSWSPGDAQSMVTGMNTVLKLLASEIVDTLK